MGTARLRHFAPKGAMFSKENDAINIALLTERLRPMNYNETSESYRAAYSAVRDGGAAWIAEGRRPWSERSGP